MCVNRFFIPFVSLENYVNIQTHQTQLTDFFSGGKWWKKSLASVQHMNYAEEH